MEFFHSLIFGKSWSSSSFRVNRDRKSLPKFFLYIKKINTLNINNDIKCNDDDDDGTLQSCSSFQWMRVAFLYLLCILSPVFYHGRQNMGGKCVGVYLERFCCVWNKNTNVRHEGSLLLKLIRLAQNLFMVRRLFLYSKKFPFDF